MKISKKKQYLTAACALACAAAFSGTAMADVLLFDRGLPTANLNNGALGNRSNVAWGDAGTTVSIGDNFTLATTDNVNDIRVWVVSGSSTPLTSTYQLWLGNDIGLSSTVSKVATSTSVVSTTYAGGIDYQGSSGNFINIFQVDFAGLGLTLGAGTYAFGVSGYADPGYVPPLTTPFLSASNGPLSGSTQAGDDGFIYGFTSTGALDTANGYPWQSNGPTPGWDKNSDINVQVFGSVPEPGSLALVGLALFGAAATRRFARR
jgi:hypothetical protein